MKTILFLFLSVLTTTHLYSQPDFCMSNLPDLPSMALTSPAFAQGDFNNDGQVDFCTQAITNDSTFTSRGVQLFLSNGTGSYTTTYSYSVIPTYTTHINQIVHVVSGDFNNDGNQDIIALSSADSVFFLLSGNGAGTFTSTTSYTSVSVPITLVASDLNKDGIPDIAYSCKGSNLLFIRYATANGFSSPVSYPLLNNIKFIVPGDFNNNGITDLFVSNGSASYFLSGGATNSFTTIHGFNLNANDIICLDVNSDNKLDIVYTNTVTEQISILKGNGNFNFSSALNYTVTGLAGSTSLGRISSGDFNNDGNPDLVTISSVCYIALLPGVGDGSFLAPVSYSVQSSGLIFLHNFTVADVNNDSKADVVALAHIGTMPFSSLRLMQNCNTVEVGITELHKEVLGFRLFPNPATNYIEIELSNALLFKEVVTVSMYNHLGQLIREENLLAEDKTLILKTDDFTEGSYFLQLNTKENKRIHKRFVITRP